MHKRDLNTINTLAEVIINEPNTDKAKYAAQEIQRIIDNDAEFTPVIHLANEEIEMFGGNAEDADHIAERLAEAIMENGYWHILRIVIEEME